MEGNIIALLLYFYSMDNQESKDSKNGIARLNKAVSNVYFVKIKDKEVVIENQKVKSMDNYNTDYKKSKDKNTYNNIKQKADNKKI